jgi:putative ABC transport system permease protein
VSAIPLGYLDLALAASFLCIHAAASLALRLGITRQIAVAAVRMAAQLALLGVVLETLFRLVSPFWTGVAAVVMVLVAGWEARARQKRRLAGWWSYGLGTASMLTAAGLVTVVALTAIVGAAPWYTPRYALPLLGMILGNTMTGIAIGVDPLPRGAARDRNAVEARLALGETKWVALSDTIRDAMRSGLIPIVNAMAATGVVAIPGMMTGQLLAGASPEQAIKYQLMIMFLIAGGTGLGVLAAVYLTAARLTDARHRLRLDRLGEAAR